MSNSTENFKLQQPLEGLNDIYSQYFNPETYIICIEFVVNVNFWFDVNILNSTISTYPYLLSQNELCIGLPGICLSSLWWNIDTCVGYSKSRNVHIWSDNLADNKTQIALAITNELSVNISKDIFDDPWKHILC